MVKRRQGPAKQQGTSFVRGQPGTVPLTNLPGALKFLNQKLVRCLKTPLYPWNDRYPETEVNRQAKRPAKRLDLSQVMLKTALKYHFNSIAPIPDDSLALLDVHPDDPRQEENIHRKPMLDRGLQLMSEGKVAVVCLAGDSWIHSDEDIPVGMLDIGLPSGKSLFQLHAERLRRIQAMAQRMQEGIRKTRVVVPLIILTTPRTNDQVQEFFSKHGFFHLLPKQVKFILQEDLPCISESGSFICDSEGKIVKAYCGDGGLYMAMARSGVLKQLEVAGVQYIDVFQAGNALARVADPHLVGHADLCGADVCAKVVAKAFPGQPGSMFVLRNGQPELMESSLLTFRETMKITPETGKLKYNWANQGSFCFTPTFMRRAYLDQETSHRYHTSQGVIFTDKGPVTGSRLLARIHDPLHLARNMVFMEVDPAAHFAPVTKPLPAVHHSRIPASVSPSRDTVADTSGAARFAVLALHRRWVRKFGGVIDMPTGWEGPEISPLKSYLGESLGYAVCGRRFSQPFDPILQGRITDPAETKQILDLEQKGGVNPGMDLLVTHRLKRWEPEADNRAGKYP